MTKSELKSTALESMSQAGAAMQQGNYREAHALAEKAWNCYYELQRQRGDDEDFTDLICYARDMYFKAEEALAQQQSEQLQEEADETDPGEFTIEDLEIDLDLQLAEQKDAIANNAPDSYAVYSATYDVLISQVMLAEKRIARATDCWKNIQLVRDFMPGVRYMMQSPRLDKQAHDNMLDLSLRAFECLYGTLVPTSPLCSPRLKRELEQLIVEVAEGMPGQDVENYRDVIDTLDYYINAADNGELDKLNTEFYGWVYDPVEMTAQYEQLLPEADKRGEKAYRLKGDAASPHDFYNAKRMYLAAMGLAWTPPRQA